MIREPASKNVENSAEQCDILLATDNSRLLKKIDK